MTRQVLLASLLSGLACSGQIGPPSSDEGASGASGAPPVSARGSEPARSGTAPGASGGAPAVAIAPGRCELPRQRVWRLTPSQIARTLESVFGARAVDPAFKDELGRYVPPLEPFGNASAALVATPGYVQELFEAARDLARAAVANLPALNPCFAKGVSRACVGTAVAELGLKAWRRPVAADEVQDYLVTFDQVAAKSSPTTAVEYVLRRLLAAPDMLFRFELGAPAASGLFTLTPHELANALAYAIADGPPDAELMAAARDGGLATPAQIEAHARRLLERAESAAGVAGFVRELFRVTGTGHPDQPEEARRFVEQALWRDPAGVGRLATLLQAEYSFANAALQKHYGWNRSSTAAAFEQTAPPAAEARAGLLTRGGVLAAFHNRSDRGRFLRETLLCSEVPKPPVDVNQDLEAQTAVLQRQLGRAPSEDEVRQRHMADPACSGCHRLIDPLGRPFAAFDDKGVWRAVEKATGKPYDTRAEIGDAGDLDGAVSDARELGRRLAASRAVRACVARQAFQFVAGRDPSPEDGCWIERAAAHFEQSGGDTRQLFLALVTGDAFRFRRPAEK